MIYHYTSIDTLELILKSKKIRFNNLNDLDDTLEGDLFIKKSLAQLIFVSCWTIDPDENIPLWMMYTKGKGVRIGLPEYPWRKINCKNWRSKGMVISYDPNMEYYSPFTFEEIFGENYMILPPYFNPIPNNAFMKKVIYLSENELVKKYSDVYSEKYKEGGKFRLSISPIEFGLHKHERWAFQKEFRFVLFICPLDRKPDVSKDNERKLLMDTITDYIKYERKSPIKDFYIQLDDKILETAEIMMGPLCTESDENKLTHLMKKFDLKSKILKSKAAIRCNR